MSVVAKTADLVRPGTILGDTYKIVRLIGTGGMGVVYEARHVRTEGKLAVKVLRPALALEAAVIERFQREARTAASVEHEGVAHIFDINQDPSGFWYIAMELLQGRDVENLLQREGPLAVDRALFVIEQAIDALEAAHDRDIVHRDIKPSNIFLVTARDREQVKILDFGISKLGERSSGLSTGMVLGTPLYMSPEQACGSHNVDRRSDVYSLGAVLYEMLTGSPPFPGKTIPEIIGKLLTQEPDPVRRKNRDIPPQVEVCIMRALAKDPEARLQSMAQFREALKKPRAVTDTLPAFGEALPKARRPGPTEEARAAAARRREELRLVTILCVSIAAGGADGGMGFSSEGSYERIMALMEKLRGIIERHNGYTEKIFSSSLIAVFGVPRTRGDDAVRAVRGAIAMNSAVEKESAVVRIGVGTGRVLAGGIVEGGLGYSIVGEAVNMARRLEGINEAGGVLIDEETFVHVRGRFRTRPVGSIAPEGLDKEKEARGFPVYKVIEEYPYGLLVCTRDISGIRAPMLGRDSEIAYIKTLFNQTTDERRLQAVTLLGPAGIGKSRLVFELRAGVEEIKQDILTLLGQSRSHTQDTPLALILDILRTKTGVKIGEDRKASRAKVADLMAMARGIDEKDRARVAHAFNVALGVEERYVDDVDLGLMLRFALKKFLEGLSSWLTVLVVLEDLHWADESSLDILDGVLQQMQEKPVFVLATAREELKAKNLSFIVSRDWHLTVELKPLSPRASKSLLECYLVPERLYRLIDKIISLSGGNPLFIEEFAETLSARERAEDKGACDADGKLQLPSRIEAVIQERLDTLDEAEIDLIRKASVQGPKFWEEALSAMDVGKPEPVLRRLEHGGFIHLQPDSYFALTSEYRFKHDLICDVAYASIPPSQKQAMHRQFAGWLKERKPSSFSDYMFLAGHHESGGQEKEAAEAYLIIGELVYESGGRKTEFKEAVKAASKSRDTFIKLKDKKGRCKASGQLGVYLSKLGMHKDSIPLLEEAINLAQGILSEEVVINYLFALASARASIGFFRESKEIIGQCRKIVASSENLLLESQLEKSTALIYFFEEDFEKAALHSMNALALAEKIGKPYEVAVNLHNIGDMQCIHAGKYEDAKKYFNRSNEICLKENFDKLAKMNSAYLAYLDFREDKNNEKINLLENILKETKTNEYPWDEIQVYILLGKCHHISNNISEARASLLEARKITERLDMKKYLHQIDASLRELEEQGQ
jgi:class 3 adenylate cyclase/tetratricopeptide (TPR) repeat protein